MALVSDLILNCKSLYLSTPKIFRIFMVGNKMWLKRLPDSSTPGSRG